MYRVLSLLPISLASLILAPDAHAIVVRHDRPDSEYVDLGSQYPTAATVLPDGSGALIAPSFVLTAGHVARGVADRQPRVEIAGEAREVDRLFIHPDWEGHGAHDVGLLRLAEPITDVPAATLYRRDDEVGRVVTFVGRGDTGTGNTGPISVDRKMRGATNRVDDADGDWLYFTFDEAGAATPLEGVSGPGDSGGPAFVELDGTLYVLGVSVFSFNGKPGRYGTREGYTRVSKHADWIESIVSGTSDDPGFAPGNAPERGSRANRAVVRPGPTDLDLSEVSGGEVIAGYIDAYNSADDARTLDFLKENFSDNYTAGRTEDQHLAFIHRLSGEFGQLTMRGVVEASDARVIIRVVSEKGAEAELHFAFGADGRIDDLMVAKIDVVKR